MIDHKPCLLLAEGLELGAGERPGSRTFAIHRLVADLNAYDEFMARCSDVATAKSRFLRVEPLADRPPFMLFYPCLNSIGLQVESGNIKIAEHVHGLFSENQ